MSRCFTTSPPPTNTARTEAIGWWTTKWASLCFKIQSKTIKYDHLKLKRDVTSVEWIQCDSSTLITDVSEIRLRCNHKIDMHCVSYMTCTLYLVSFYNCLHRKRTLYMKYMNMSQVQQLLKVNTLRQQLVIQITWWSPQRLFETILKAIL